MKQPKLSDLKIDAKGTKKIRTKMAKTKKVKITINLDDSKEKPEILEGKANE